MLIWLALLSSIIFLLSAFLFHKAAGSLSPTKINIVSWIFYVQLILQTFIGINLAIFGTYHYMVAKAPSSAVQLAYFAVCYVLIVMPLSMIVFQKVVSRRSIRKKLIGYYRSKVVPLQSSEDSAQLVFWILFSLVALLATAYVYLTIRSFPILALLSGSDEHALLRQDAAQFSGNVYVRNYLALITSQLASYVAFGYALMRRTAPMRLWFLGTFIVAVLAVTYSGEKAPVLNYLIGLFLILGFFRGGFKTRHMLGVAALAFLLIGGFYLARGQLTFAVNTGPVGRILLSQIAGLPLHLHFFPKLHPFLEGGSFPAWMSSLWGAEHIRSARLIMEYVNPVGFAEGRAGVINTLFIAEAWANFGWLGFFGSPIIVGVVVQFLHNLFLSSRKSPVFVATMAYFMLKIPITGGFVDFMWNAGWLFLFLLLYSSLLARPILLGAKRNQLSQQP